MACKSVYLAPSSPRVVISSEGELQALADQGLLEETHFLELKEKIAAPSQRVNRELARDLASFAMDGGTVLVGVAEQDDGSLQLTPQPLDGLAERVEQSRSDGAGSTAAGVGAAGPLRCRPEQGVSGGPRSAELPSTPHG